MSVFIGLEANLVGENDYFLASNAFKSVNHLFTQFPEAMITLPLVCTSDTT